MLTRPDTRSAPSLLRGPYPQKELDNNKSALQSLEGLIARSLLRLDWRSSRRQHRLEALAKRESENAPMARVIRAWEGCNAVQCSPQVVSAALALRENRSLLELPDFDDCEQAALLAALCLALEGSPVHLVYPKTPEAPPGLAEVAEELGLRVATLTDGQSLNDRRQSYACHIVAVSCRQLMFDYLLDQRVLGQARGPVLSRLKSRLSDEPHTFLPGLACALVVGAREVLIEQAAMPVGISEEAEARKSHVHDFYTDALGIAGQLFDGVHYDVAALMAAPVFTAIGRDHLTELTQGLGPLWRGVRRSETIVCAAIIVLQLREGTDYVVNATGLDLQDCLAELPDLEGIGAGEYRRLLNAKHDTGSGTAAPPVSKRLSMQHFFPRYLHLAATGWMLQPRRKELERVYGLASLPAMGHILYVKAQPKLSRSVTDWQRLLCASLEQLRERGANVLLVSPDADSLQALHDFLGVEWQGILQRPSEDDMSSLVGGLFLSLTIDEALHLDSSQVPSGIHSVVFAGTPATILDESLVCHRFAATGDAVLFASLEDGAFTSRGAFLKLVCPRNRLAYNALRRQLESAESSGRAHVAAHDAYVRQTLAFSGDTI
jgi:hypothetical protein